MSHPLGDGAAGVLVQKMALSAKNAAKTQQKSGSQEEGERRGREDCGGPWVRVLTVLEV